MSFLSSEKRRTERRTAHSAQLTPHSVRILKSLHFNAAHRNAAQKRCAGKFLNDFNIRTAHTFSP
jgi:hypothetical protein